MGLWSISSSDCDVHGSINYACQDVANEPILQFLPTNVASDLAGKIVTVGSWVYLFNSTEFRAPDLLLFDDNARRDTLKGELNTATGEWQFVYYEAQIPEGVSDIAVVLYIPEATNVSWEGVILAEGAFSGSGETPVFDNVTADSGEWSGSRFTNLLKNGSGENTWTGVPSVIVNLMKKYGKLNSHVRMIFPGKKFTA